MFRAQSAALPSVPSGFFEASSIMTRSGRGIITVSTALFFVFSSSMLTLSRSVALTASISSCEIGAFAAVASASVVSVSFTISAVLSGACKDRRSAFHYGHPTSFARDTGATLKTPSTQASRTSSYTQTFFILTNFNLRSSLNLTVDIALTRALQWVHREGSNLMVTESLTRRQSKLIADLRDTEQQISALIRRRKSISAELERIYPHARELSPAPLVRGDVISVWNYVTLDYEAQVVITAKGKKALDGMNPALKTVQLRVLALLLPRSQGADLTKLLNLPIINEEPNYKRYVKRLDEAGYIHIEYTSNNTKIVPTPNSYTQG